MADLSFRQNSISHSSQLIIPLISKRMNNVEKYISDFSMNADSSRVPQSRKDTIISKKLNQSDRREVHHYRSAQLSPQAIQQQLQLPKKHCCVKYSSILDKKSEDRIESLSRLEKDYKLLKQKMQPNKKTPRALFSINKGRNQTSDIAEEDVEKELKTSIINQNGKKYFADLYLLKKGREQIMNSLTGAGKMSIQQQRSYQQKVKSSEHEFVKQKILQDREVKRTKMLKGRNLHWNVYYDMLALSTSEKKKLKGICKFTSTFGIV